MYNGLSQEICQTAWDITRSSVVKAAEAGVTNKLAGTIVVCYTHLSGAEEFDMIFTDQVNGLNPDAEKYDTIAAVKATVSWDTGLPSRKVQQDAPHLYKEGMTKWGGSVVENGLIVAFSGVEPVFDEAIAGTMLRWIVALCQHEMTKPGGVMASEDSFIR